MRDIDDYKELVAMEAHSIMSSEMLRRGFDKEDMRCGEVCANDGLRSQRDDFSEICI